MASTAPPGLVSSAGWKISRTPRVSRPSSRSRDHPDAEHDRGVHVVTAGVRDAGDLRGEVDRAAVRDRQGVEVGPQADQAVALLVEAVREHVAPGAGADRQHLGHQAAGLENLDHPGGGAVLGVADLGVRVEVAADGDQPLVQLVDLGDDASAAHVVVDGGRHRRSVCHGARAVRRLRNVP
jgi:hypothetical protein